MEAEDYKFSPDEAAEIVRLSMEDPAFFCRTFLPDWFPLQMPWFHRGIFAILARQVDWLLKFGEEQWPKEKAIWTQGDLEKIIKYFVWQAEPDDPLCEKVPLFEAEYVDGTIVGLTLSVSDKMLIICPRGASKTTILNAHDLREIVHHSSDFLVYLSETASHAEMQLDTIKRELEANQLLRTIYGNKKPERTDPEKWSQKWIETTDGFAIAAKGRGGQVRGMNHRAKRPSRIVFDDVEDKESVKTPEQRTKCSVWLKADVEQALPQIAQGGGGRIVGLGTVLHHDSLLMRLSRDPEWIVIRFGAVLPPDEGEELEVTAQRYTAPTTEQMLWPHYMSAADYKRKRSSFQRAGMIAEFSMEFLSATKIEGDGAKFKGPFIYKHMDHMLFPGRAIVVDPAISPKKESALCAFGVVGMTEQGNIHILDVYMQRGMTPREQVDKYFELKFKWDCTLHGVEAIAYQVALIHLLKEEMFRRGKLMGPSAYFEIEPIKHGATQKRQRVEGVLAPRYTSGYISHERHFPEYEQHLLDWPNSFLDGPDVIAMAVTLLDPLAGFAYDPEAEDGKRGRLEDDQYEKLTTIWSSP